MSSDATYTSFSGPSRGKVAVVLSRAAWRGPDVPGHVKVTIARRRGSSPGKPIATRTFTIHSGKTRKLLLPAPAGPYTVSVHIAPTFSPSQFGQADTRQLGAIVYFAVTAHVAGIDIQTVGLILMIVGVVGLALGLILTAQRSSRRPPDGL